MNHTYPTLYVHLVAKFTQRLTPTVCARGTMATAAASWSELFECAAEDVQQQRQFAAQLTRRLQDLAKEGSKLRLSSGAVASALGTAELAQLLAKVDTGAQGQAALTALNGVIRAAPTLVSAALAENGIVEALITDLHKRIDLAHSLSPAVFQALHALVTRCEDIYGHTDVLSVKQELTELVVTAIIWMGNNPDILRRPEVLATANRAVQMCWCLCRHGTQPSGLVAELFVTVDIAGRVLHLSGALASDAFRRDMPDPSQVLPASVSPSPGPHAKGATVGELCVSLVAVCSSLAAALLGLGGALDATAGGLHGLRSWLLQRTHLQDLHLCLGLLSDELPGGGPLLAHLRAAASSRQQGADGEEQEEEEEVAAGTRGLKESSAQGAAGQQEGAPEAAASASSQREGQAAEEEPPSRELAAAAAAAAYEESLRSSVEGAVRNLLTLLVVPLLCADPAQQREVRALSSFALQYCYMLYQEHYSELLKRLGNRRGPYRGVYLAFFCGASDLLHDTVHTIGHQFNEWGVQLDREDEQKAAGEQDSMMFVPTTGGVDAATAKTFIAQQVVNSVELSQKMRKIIMLSQRAAASRQLQVVQAATAAHAQQSGGQPQASCSFCGKESARSSLKSCPCGLTKYCNKTCQLAHFPRHKGECKEARKQKGAEGAAELKQEEVAAA